MTDKKINPSKFTITKTGQVIKQQTKMTMQEIIDIKKENEELKAQIQNIKRNIDSWCCPTCDCSSYYCIDKIISGKELTHSDFKP